VQTTLKISFWISVALAIADVFLLPGGIHETPHDIAEAYLIVLVFALPGFFIRARFYRLASITILGIASVVIMWGISYRV
jgi:hypothetical protein